MLTPARSRAGAPPAALSRANPTGAPPEAAGSAAVNRDPLRDRVARIGSNQPCAIAEGDVGHDRTVSLTGPAGVSAAKVLRQAPVLYLRTLAAAVPAARTRSRPLPGSAITVAAPPTP